MDALLTNASENSSSPEATSSVASRFTTPELDGPYRGGQSAAKASSVWEGRKSDERTLTNNTFPGASNMTDRMTFQAPSHQHRATMPSDSRQQRWQQYQYAMANAADRSPTETERITMHNQQYLESPSWRLPSTTAGGANNLAVTSAPQDHEYSVLQWQQLQQQQLHQRPHRQQQSVSSMDGFYAYCFDRGNGTYTRLIPADMIPPLMNIPATQMGCEGMLVLPLPLRPPPYGPASNIEPVTVLKTPPPSPEPGSDTIQKKIDHIVATTPTPQKKPKIYCDKWVHEGVCAFTQQGCKYKHEMPLDKATQMSLGLFHGLPTWWKKQQAERQREQPEGGFGGGDNNAGGVGGGGAHSMTSNPRSSSLAATPDTARMPQAVSWRRTDSATANTVAGMSMMSAGGGTATMASSTYPTNMGGLRSPVSETRPFTHQSSTSPTSPCIFGPIGPPLRHGASEGGGPTSYPSNMAMNAGRGGTSVRDTNRDDMSRSRMDHLRF